MQLTSRQGGFPHQTVMGGPETVSPGRLCRTSATVKASLLPWACQRVLICWVTRLSRVIKRFPATGYRAYCGGPLMLIIVRGTTGSFLRLARTLPVVFKTKNGTLTRLLGSPTFTLFRRREIIVIKGHGPFPIIDLCAQLFPRWSWVFIIPSLQPLSVFFCRWYV